MTAAIAQRCVICHTSSSKYKCPTCRSPTCCLSCSKQHAAQEHTSQGSLTDTSTKVNLENTSESLPPLRNRDELLQSPSSQRFGTIDKYISMKEYDSKQFLQDFEYLQYIGKCVGTLGKEIVKNGWLKEMEERAANNAASHHSQQHQGLSQRGQSNGRGRGGGGVVASGSSRQNQNVPAEIKSRLNLESWIRKLKLPIMLVPNGMSWRKENQTWWKNNSKELFCTVEIKIASMQTSTNNRSILHRLSWDKTISSVVCKYLERRYKHRKNLPAQSPLDIISILDRFCDEKGRLTSDRWQENLCITVDVANDRLRNESSSKFLEWWQRQVKNGMVKADGLELDEEKRHALDEMRRGAWAEIEGIDKSTTSAAVEVQNGAELDAIMTDTGLISSSILAKIQAIRAKRLEEDVAGPSVEEESTPCLGLKKKVIIVGGQETFQDVLRYMPSGFAIVEYFHLQIWEKSNLMKEVKKGNLIKVDLEGREESVADVTAELRKRALESRDEKQAIAKKAKMDSSTALNCLNAYDTSSDEEDSLDALQLDEEDITAEAADDYIVASEPASIGGLAEITRSLGMVSSA